MNIGAIVKTAWIFAEPAVKTAGQVAIGVGALLVANKAYASVSTLADKAVIGVRGLFSSNNPTASGNRKSSVKKTKTPNKPKPELVT